MIRLALLVCLTACVFATAARAAAPAPTTRPNVLFIICDDLTTTAIGCYGNKVCKTPNIDRLASMGVRFEHAYCNWPLCLPSRNSFLAGRRPDAKYSAAGLLRERVPDVEFLPEHFRKNGYFTARVGKLFHTRTVFAGLPIKTLEDPACWDVSEVGGTDIDPCGYSVLFSSIPKGLESHPELQKITVEHELLNKAGQPAYDYWMEMAKLDVSDEQCVDGNIAARITQLMEERSKPSDGKPFFLAAGFRRPHLLWVAPKKYFDLYDWHAMELPREPADDLDDIPKIALTRRAPNMTDEQRKKAIAAYYACVTEADTQVGKLLDAMDRLKLWESTIVLFTSDHGWHLDEHGMWGKVSLFEESARIPLIVVVPGMTRDAQSPRTVEMIDFFPTLCELAGLSLPPKLDGASIAPQLRDPSASRDKPAIAVVRHGKTWGKAVYTERYRYTEWGDYASKGVELYDHANDPKEYTNLAKHPTAEQTAMMKEMKAILDREVHVKDGDVASPSGD